MTSSDGKRARGDWQTPLGLAEAVLAQLVRDRAASDGHVASAAPETVLEPTCGEGSFLEAAAAAFPGAELLGYELRKEHAKRARARLPSARTRVKVADFFDVDWERVIAAGEGPLLIVGNPPWVTTATLGVLGASNGPRARTVDGLRGLEALTGKSNFDLAEAVILRLLGALCGGRPRERPRRATLAMLCKASVARRVIERATSARWDVAPGGLYAIDALRHFGAAVSAVLFVCEIGAAAPPGLPWPSFASFASLDARAPGAAREAPTSQLTVTDGVVIADAEAHARTAHLAGACAPEWRSGLKHDCASVMELTRDGDAWRNGLGEVVAIEAELIFPLAKGADLVDGGPPRPERAVVVPQRALGEDTAMLAERAPRGWRYLCAHRARLGARKSAVYRGRPEFSIFGVGPYAFAPWKVAVSGLHKRCAFVLLGPRDGRAIVLDDTCYFLPFDDEAAARAALALLQSPLAKDFFAARIFWEAKRPISKAILQRLSLSALAAAMQTESAGPLAPTPTPAV
jgi:methylase of polypeptide subunit release factors